MNNSKQISVLYQLYKSKVKEMSLDYNKSIKLMNVFISEFIKFEEYETAAYFKRKKINMYKSWRKSKRFLSIKLFYRVWRLRLFKIKKLMKG